MQPVRGRPGRNLHIGFTWQFEGAPTPEIGQAAAVSARIVGKASSRVGARGNRHQIGAGQVGKALQRARCDLPNTGVRSFEFLLQISQVQVKGRFAAKQLHSKETYDHKRSRQCPADHPISGGASACVLFGRTVMLDILFDGVDIRSQSAKTAGQ